MALLVFLIFCILAYYAVEYISSLGPVKNPLLELIFQALRADLPHRETMDGYLDFILPKIRRFGEGIDEKNFYLNKRWLEIRDDENFHESVLHIFKDKEKSIDIKVHLEDQGASYLYIINGNVMKGTWVQIEGGALMLKAGQNFELYDLVFLSDDFFILRKHGDQSASGRRYLFLTNERLGKGLTWREILELLYDIYRYNLSFLLMVLIIMALVGIVAIYSINSLT